LLNLIINPKTKKQFFNLTSNYAYGNIIPTNPFVKGENREGLPQKHYQAFSLKVLWQNPGYRNWQKVFKGPHYGLGITRGDFFNSTEIGYPISYYGVLGLPIKR
jgi:hypothetical protein